MRVWVNGAGITTNGMYQRQRGECKRAGAGIRERRVNRYDLKIGAAANTLGA